MTRAWLLSIVVCMAGCGGAGQPDQAAVQSLYEAVARGDVRYVLITRDGGEVEALLAGGERAVYAGVQDLDALAALLAKERVERHVQQTRLAKMPQ